MRLKREPTLKTEAPGKPAQKICIAVWFDCRVLYREFVRSGEDDIFFAYVIDMITGIIRSDNILNAIRNDSPRITEVRSLTKELNNLLLTNEGALMELASWQLTISIFRSRDKNTVLKYKFMVEVSDPETGQKLLGRK